MEQNLQRRVGGLRDKLPDIQKTLETVRFLKLRTVRRESSVLNVLMVLTEVVVTVRLRSDRDNLRAERYPFRQGRDTAHGRGLLVAWCKAPFLPC